MIRRSLVLALAAALCPLTVQAADLLQVYEMARNGDPQLAAAEQALRDGSVLAAVAEALAGVSADAEPQDLAEESEGAEAEGH